MTAASIELPFRVGARTFFRVRRRLVRSAVPLGDALAGRAPCPQCPDDADGLWLTGVPDAAVPTLAPAGLRPFVRQRYPRHYADLRIGFDAYYAGFSAKRRATLRRKEKKLAEASGGAIDVRSYRAPAEMRAFHRLARDVAAATYQERLLGAALPAGGAFADALVRAAEADAVRGWILHVRGEPAAYLHAPAQGDSLLYAHLGYRPAFADLSVGTMLQLHAMRDLMSEGRFRWFDFTGGDGEHKRQWATGSVPSADVLLLRPTPGNLAVGHGLGAWDGAVERGRRLLGAAGLDGVVRRLRR